MSFGLPFIIEKWNYSKMFVWESGLKFPRKIYVKHFFCYLQVPLRPPTASSNASSTSRPSLALSHKMKGFRKDMQQKISRLRSRSAERISKRLQNRSSDRHDVSIRWVNYFVYCLFLVRCQNVNTCFRNPFWNAYFLHIILDFDFHDVSKVRSNLLM